MACSSNEGFYISTVFEWRCKHTLDYSMFSAAIANRLYKAVFEGCFSYDATQVILAGIQKALEANGQKLLTPQDLASALPQITGSQAVQGVGGQIGFGPDHDPVNKAVVLLYVDGGGHIQMKSVQGCFMKGCPGL